LLLKDLVAVTTFVIVHEPVRRDELLARLVRTLTSAEGRPDLEEGQVLAGILRREDSASTGFGLGVAIPHCFLPGVGKPRMAVGCSPAGVDFRAMDGQPSHVVFLLVEDVDARAAHTAIVSRIALLCRDTALVSRLRTAPVAGAAEAALSEEDARAD
jgi:fructose PTS system EIIBC or EIIC component